MIGEIDYTRLRKANIAETVYEKAAIRSHILTKLKNPYQRPSRRKEVCLNFESDILFKRELKKIYQCPFEEGWYQN